MRSAAVFGILAVVASASATRGDPSGTIPLPIEAGKTVPVTELPGSNVICDDLQIAAPEYSPEGTAIVVRGVKPGTTLCGVWLGNQKPGGLYRVEVVAAGDAPDAGPSKVDGGSEPALGDAGLPDASVPGAPGPGGSHP
jgi:hypothetical protein